MFHKAIQLCLILTAFLLSTPVFAEIRVGSSLFVAAMSLQQAAKMVQARVGGRVLGAETRTLQGRAVHVIKVLTPDGKRVRYIQVDAESGRVSGGR